MSTFSRVERMIAFVRARLDEDDEVARAEHKNEQFVYGTDRLFSVGHALVGMAPHRAVGDIAAKRAIVDLYAEVADADTEDPEPEFACGRAVGLGEAVRLITAVWKDHRDYDDAWRAQAE